MNGTGSAIIAAIVAGAVSFWVASETSKPKAQTEPITQSEKREPVGRYHIVSGENRLFRLDSATGKTHVRSWIIVDTDDCKKKKKENKEGVPPAECRNYVWEEMDTLEEVFALRAKIAAWERRDAEDAKRQQELKNKPKEPPQQ